MKNNVYILADAVVTPLGQNTQENMEQLYALASAVKPHTHPQIGAFYASKFEADQVFPTQKEAEGKTKIERLFINSIEKALADTAVDPSAANVLFVFASTKGNIEHLSDASFDKNRLRIGVTATDVAAYFKNPNTPVVVSNACISGLQAIQYGFQVLQAGTYTHVVVTGADCFSEFILSGFHSFQALSPFPCKPFDKDRAGLSLGEGCGTLILSNQKPTKEAIRILSVASSNDANHLSGPSRTGEGLSSAILAAINEAGIAAGEIDVISAHGTATMYNDEMESLAFQTAGLQAKPVYSVKGNIGHTLGAAGIIETIYLAHSIKNNRLVPSKGFDATGTSVELNVIRTAAPQMMQIGLKTASGFGGGNTALLIKNER